MSITLHIDSYAPIHDWLADIDLILNPDWFMSKHNIEPPAPLWTVYSHFDKKKILPAEWGMNPNWAKKGQIPRQLFVARVETVFERVSYKALIKRYRALIPVNAFTAKLNVKAKRRYYDFRHKDGQTLALGALYQFNVDGNLQVVLLTKQVKLPESGKKCRVPVVVASKDVDAWLQNQKSEFISDYLDNYHLADIFTQQSSGQH